MGMVKITGDEFATPENRVLSPTLVRITQQIEVSAAHQLQAAAAEPDGPIAQIVRLPRRPGCNARFAEQALGNDAIRVAGQAPIERAESKDEPSTLLWCQRILRLTTGLACGGAPQTQRRIGPRGKIGVQRNHDGRRRRSVCAVDKNRGQTVMTVIDEPMLAVDGAASECRPLRVPIRLAFLKASGAGTTRTEPGSRCA